MAILGLAAIAISEHLVGVDVSWNPIGHANVARLTIDLPAWLGGAVTVPFLVAAAVILTITALMSAGAFGMTRKATVA